MLSLRPHPDQDLRSDGRVAPDTGEAELLDPRERLVEMLLAFERHVAIQDRTLLDISLATIQRTLFDEAPRRFVVELAGDGRPREIDLAEAPDFAEVRKDISVLIGRLLEDGFRYEEDV